VVATTPAAELSALSGPEFVMSKLMKEASHTEEVYLAARTRSIRAHFPTALGVDDFLSRLEIALFSHGFTGENSIAMSNLCRDEVTSGLKHKIDAVFGSSFNTNGLGGVLTCGVTGVKAGLSHSPVSAASGKERYVFLSFPHIAIDAEGAVGAIARPGRPSASCACGALNAALIDIQASGLDANCKVPGQHDPLDPEYSILKQRLARRIRYEGLTGADVAALDLCEMTRVADRTITDDLEYLIKHSVDTRRADYAVVTGVQVHSWGRKYNGEGPNLEYIAPSTVYTVVNGQRTYLDLASIPAMTPRQLKLLASESGGGGGGGHGGDGHAAVGDHGRRLAAGGSQVTTIVEESKSHSVSGRKAGVARFSKLLAESEVLEVETSCPWPGWQTRIRARGTRGEDDTSCNLDESWDEEEE
jgi:hypothetical protein